MAGFANSRRLVGGGQGKAVIQLCPFLPFYLVFFSVSDYLTVLAVSQCLLLFFVGFFFTS